MTNSCGATFAPRLWIYTNFDCNLRCGYCCARSSPRAERRALSLVAHRKLVDEAVESGITEVFLTGGEPFLLPDIAERIRYAAERTPTTVLTNAMLFHGRRREALDSLSGLKVTLQVSLDAPEPAGHDCVRGPGSWAKAVEGIHTLLDAGFTVGVSTTETAANAHNRAAMPEFVRSLGIPAERHFFRPLARRGFSATGMEVSPAVLEPEVTVSLDGVFWHPLACEEDMLITRRISPFGEALAEAHRLYHTILASGALPQPFR